MNDFENDIAFPPCPNCGSTDYGHIYRIDPSDDVIGCSDCVHAIDSYVYLEEEEERAYDEHVNALVDAALGK